MMRSVQEDDFLRWIAVRCVFPADARTTLQTLHHDYLCWRSPERTATGNDRYKWRAVHIGKHQFSALLRQQGFAFAKSSQRFVIGIALMDKDPWNAPADTERLPITSFPDDSI